MRALVALVAVGCGRLDFQALDDASGVQPIAYWPLDEGTGVTTTDVIGGITGTLQPGATVLPTWTAGEHGAAVAFIGDGDAIYIGPEPIAANLAQLSIVAWVKLGVSNPGTDECPMDHGDGTSGWAFLLERNVAGEIGFNASFVGGDVERDSIAGTLQVGSWTHVAVTWDGGSASTGIHVYVDGVEVQYGTAVEGIGARLDDSNVNLTINCSANTTLHGAIDDVKLFDRVLASEQLRAL